MSNSAANIYDLLSVAQGQIDNIAAVEYPAAGLTLTRSASLALITAGTLITWQVETRGYAITWAGTTVTIPSSGYYTFSLNYNSNVLHTVRSVLFINAVSVLDMTVDTISNLRHGATITRYFTENDAVQLMLLPSVNTTMTVVAENGVSESPFLHVVQLTGSIE